MPAKRKKKRSKFRMERKMKKLTKTELVRRLSEYTIKTVPGYVGHEEDAKKYWLHACGNVRHLSISAFAKGLITREEYIALDTKRRG